MRFTMSALKSLSLNRKEKSKKIRKKPKPSRLAHETQIPIIFSHWSLIGGPRVSIAVRLAVKTFSKDWIKLKMSFENVISKKSTCWSNHLRNFIFNSKKKR
jgi:hypothetical protein